MAIALDELDSVDSKPVAAAVATKPRATRQRTVTPVATSAGATHSVSTQRGTLFFDLETIPDYERQEAFGLKPIPLPAKRGDVSECPPIGDVLKQTLDKIKEDLKSYNPCDEYLALMDAAERSAQKPRKGVTDATADLRKQDAARDALIDDQRKKMATTPEFNRIVAMGWALGGEVQSLIVGERKNDGADGKIEERDILEAFWNLAKSAKHVCGFNILGFDLPTIFVRSILLDVAPTRSFDMKPWSDQVIDLMLRRFGKIAEKDFGLKRIAKAMGLEVPAGDVDGSQVEQLWKQSPEKVGEYVRSDVTLVKVIHQRYSGFFC